MPTPRGKQQSRVVTLERSRNQPRDQELSGSPLYGVAMLKIAMELKKTEPRSVDDLIQGVLTKMRLNEGDFRRFLEANGGLLRAIAQKRYV